MFSHSLIQIYRHPPPSTSVSTSPIKSMETTVLRMWYLMFSQWCLWRSKLLGCDNTSLYEWMLAFQESHYHLQRCQSLKVLEFFKRHKPLTQHHSVTAQKTTVTMLKHTELRTELRKLPATSTMYSTSWSGLFVIRSATHTMGLCKVHGLICLPHCTPLPTDHGIQF